MSTAHTSGLTDNADRIGKDWHPFGTEEEHEEAARGSGEGEDAGKETQPKEGILHGLTNSFQRLGTKLRGKSHRFSDLLRLHKEVKRDLSDPVLYPELEKDAFLRRNNELSEQEVAFMRARRDHIVATGALKRFLQLDEREEVHPDDIPVIGLGGSGGGYRACLGFLAYIEEMQQEAGEGGEGEKTSLWDLVMFVAGVSGSCWSIGG